MPKSDIVAYLDGAGTGPLEPIPVPFAAPGLASQIDGFEGYEAIAFAGERAFLTIEASAGGMMGYLVAGQIAPDLSALTLDTDRLLEIPPQSASANNLTYHSRRPGPFLCPTSSTASPTPPRWTSRIASGPSTTFTPATRTCCPKPTLWPSAMARGRPTPCTSRWSAWWNSSTASQGSSWWTAPPIQLELLPDGEARNWEGLVRLDDRGFLLITDEFPETILGFVAFTEEE